MKKLAPFLVLLAGILWGMIGIFVRHLDDIDFSSMDIVAIRSIATVILMFLFLLLCNRKMFKIKLKDLWCFIGTGVFSVVFFNVCYFKAMTITSLSVAAVLLYTAPIFVMLMSAVLFHEKITKRKFVAIVITFLGCIFVTGIIGTSAALSVKGILLGLGAGLGYALYSIFSRYALKRGYHSLTITFYTFVFATIGTIPFTNIRLLADECMDLKMLGFFLLFGLVSTVLPYIVYTRGLKEMENSRASIIASIEPVTASVLGVVVYGESLAITQIIGVVLVLAGILFAQKK